ncbi:hypothetical protein WB401_17950 [Streptomyces brasiliscabiei]|uniref:Uncharacterized protein n=1 Tax=Streptomyces brasiliscabiei TaxID=2736302 RepID=A0ABU8GB08_9ACTN
MTTDGLRAREPRRTTETIDTGDGPVRGRAARPGDRPTTVTVMPLWARPRAGVRG